MGHLIVQSLEGWSAAWGNWFYVFLFILIFAETGLVVVPFLPGDSVLLAVGALASRTGSSLDVWIAGVVMCTAAICGDSANYWFGRWLGPRVFRSETSRFLNKKHLERAHGFYERHGGITVIVCRFLVVIRTFAPFVAGIGAMRYRRFVAYSVFGTLLWVWLFLLVGYWLGRRFADKVDFVIYGIVAFALVPPFVSWLRERSAERRSSKGPGSGP